MVRVQADSSSTGLPPGWEVRHSNSKNLPYYFNGATKESRWDPPAGTDTDKLRVYVAQHASYLQSGRPAQAAQGSSDGKIRASHLLVKHRDSRRASSWREVSTSFKSSQGQSLRLCFAIRDSGLRRGVLCPAEAVLSSPLTPPA